MIEDSLAVQTARYLNQVLGEGQARLSGPPAGVAMPYFLQDSYETVIGELAGQPIALACARDDQALPARQRARHVELMRGVLAVPVIVALPRVTAGERRQLIAHGLPFVVPGQQLFAPLIGLILRERFAAAPVRDRPQVSPATQALLIWFLLHKPVTPLWHPFEEAAALGYAGMTATRAIRELLQLGLFELETHGRAKHLRLTTTRRELWHKAKPHLHTPVQRTLYTYDLRVLQLEQTRLAGESALAQMSSVNAPDRTVIAAPGSTVQLARQRGIVFEQRELPDAVAVQIWRYTPAMQAAGRNVDPLSLWLSLRDSADDRIQLALDEVEKNFTW